MMPGRALSGGALLTAGALVQAGLGLGAQLVLMRLLVPEDFGEFATTFAVCGLVQMVLSLRLNALIIRVPDAEMTPARRDLYRAALVWETVAAAVATLVWLGLSGLLSPYAATLVAALAVGQWSNQHMAFYERKMAYGPIALVEAGSQIAGHAVSVAMVLAGLGPAALYARELVAALARLSAFARIGALARPLWRLPNWADLRFLAGEARGMWVDGVLEGGLARLVVLGTASVVGPYGTGIFAQSQRLATIPHQLVAPVVVRLSVNLFSRQSDPALRVGLFKRMVVLTVLGLALVAAVAVALAGWAVPALLGEHWRAASSVLKAMAGLMVFFSAFELVRAYCASQRRMGLIVAARLSQYAVFGAALAIAALGSQPLEVLAWGLSATYAVSFAAASAGVLRKRAP